MKSSKIRSEFLQFFSNKKHLLVSSAPIVIKDDPSLMFTNAGMNQFKGYFLGNSVPENPRIVNTQKCLRVSGKHNDLEEVGIDTYHHTMFEMLGNWSFNDYFKKEAITWAWELLIKVYALNKDLLYVTVFGGSEELPIDKEAHALWKEIVPESHIILGNKKDNFWEMGATGPCGPCSEIHIDMRNERDREKIPGKTLINKDHPQVVELWNLVFMEFNRKADGTLQKLPAQHVDTGMGFERLCMVLQDVKSTYDTDLFTPLIREIETMTNSTYGDHEKTDVAIRVIADHLRAVAFAIADGQLPSNTGAGYVIRRILRRGIRYGFTFLHQRTPFMYKLVATFTSQMHEIFPEIKTQRNLIENVIKEEEQSFLKTLEQGLLLLDTIISGTEGTIISGAKAFELYDTFGFPVDLTHLILKERGYTLNEKEFDTELLKQKERSRAATKIETGDWVVLRDDVEQEFVGYDMLEVHVRLTRYRKMITKKEGAIYQLVFNLTPFYPEGGGQVGDKGYLKAPNGDVVYIIDTKKENNVTLHIVKTLPENKNDTFNAVVDKKQRARTAANHSGTHLLHQALIAVLGRHVTQKGSMIRSGYLRFDFSHFGKVTEEELKQIALFVNSRIREQLPLEEQRNTTYNDAINAGAIALFSEKYGDTVRIIKFGESIELCGGTHVGNTSEIWHFIITSESAVAAGIRRIEAITGDAAKEYYTSQTAVFDQIKVLLKHPKEPLKALHLLQEENLTLKKEVSKLIRDKAKHVEDALQHKIRECNGVRFLAAETTLDQNSVKTIAFRLGKTYNNLFALFAAKDKGKAILTCYISEELVKYRGYHAGKIVKELGRFIDGDGGGQAFFATAGGKNPAGILKALKNAETYIT